MFSGNQGRREITWESKFEEVLVSSSFLMLWRIHLQRQPFQMAEMAVIGKCWICI
jgi:hypothetical protein